MVGNKLSAKEEEAYRNKGAHKPRSPHHHSSPRHRSGSRRSRTPSPGRYNSPKNKGTRRSRTPNRTYDYEDDEKDYLQAVKLLGGTKETAMQSLQLHLTGAARSWLSKLGKETIGNWEELTKQFTSNFKSTYKRPASIEEVKACV
jgi:hypothetical protein